MMWDNISIIEGFMDYLLEIYDMEISLEELEQEKECYYQMYSDGILNIETSEIEDYLRGEGWIIL